METTPRKVPNRDNHRRLTPHSPTITQIITALFHCCNSIFPVSLHFWICVCVHLFVAFVFFGFKKPSIRFFVLSLFKEHVLVFMLVLCFHSRPYSHTQIEPACALLVLKHRCFVAWTDFLNCSFSSSLHTHAASASVCETSWISPLFLEQKCST